MDHHPPPVVAVLDLNLCPKLLRQPLLQLEKRRRAQLGAAGAVAAPPLALTASSIRRTDQPSSTARRATCSANRSSALTSALA